ncbi:hypothetical protein ACRRTK_016186 [Alexandromys fortis]
MSGGAAWSSGGACVSPTRVSGCRRRLLLGGTSGLSSSPRCHRRRAAHDAGGREESGRTRRARGRPWRGLRGGEQGRAWDPTWDTPRLWGRRRRGPPAPRPPRAAPRSSHRPPAPPRLARQAAAALGSPAPALGSGRLGAMGECDPADVCSRPAGRLVARVVRRAPRGVGAGPAPGRALLEPGGRRPLHPGLAAAALPSPLPPRCGAPASEKKRHQLGGGQTHEDQSPAEEKGLRCQNPACMDKGRAAKGPKWHEKRAGLSSWPSVAFRPTLACWDSAQLLCSCGVISGKERIP